MKELYLANNNLTGPLSDLTRMDFLTYIDMSNNSFNVSVVPQWFTTLPNLTTLIMERTGLQGQIPTALFNQPLLQTVKGTITGTEQKGWHYYWSNYIWIYACTNNLYLLKTAERASKLINPFVSWDQDEVPQLKGVRCFSFEDIKKCTNGFSNGREIGSGGYGKVYKGRLHTGQLVAIKRAQQGSLQGALEFKTEIELLSRVHHKNVVDLVGFCYDEGEQMLIYEFVPNDSLRALLSGTSGVRLNWMKRLRVALGAARGLAYLRELADPPIIHRDIKSSNILLDDHLNAKVADFGLSKPLMDDKDYIHPSLGHNGVLGSSIHHDMAVNREERCLQFRSGDAGDGHRKMALEKTKYIVRQFEESLNESENIHHLNDPAIGSDNLIGLREFVNLAMRCVQDVGANRPTMGEVVKEIEYIIRASDPNDVVGPTSASTSNGRTREDRRSPHRIQQQWLLKSFQESSFSFR